MNYKDELYRIIIRCTERTCGYTPVFGRQGGTPEETVIRWLALRVMMECGLTELEIRLYTGVSKITVDRVRRDFPLFIKERGPRAVKWYHLIKRRVKRLEDAMIQS